MSFFGGVRKLRCFYCNQWTPRPREAGPVRQLQCRHCEAVNYFDENGDITDPPVQSTAQTSAPRYARPVPSRSRSPPPNRSSESVFCGTCRKNQHLLASALANVDPPPEKSPQYAEFEAHVRQLEARYPQVCQDCKPRARNLIKESIYHAKADNMLRIMERTQVARANGLTAFAYAWRSWLLWLGGLGWLLSVLMQVAWHVLGARVRSKPNFVEFELFAWETLEDSTWASALSTAKEQLLGPTIDPRLYVFVSAAVPGSLMLAMSTFWWNPRLRKKYLKFGRGRMVGTRDYYAMQLVVLGLRAAGWLLLGDPAKLGLSLMTFKRAHTILAVVTSLLALRSLPIVRLDTRPPVDFRRLRDEDILPDTPLPSDPTNAAGITPSKLSNPPSNPLLQKRTPNAKFDISLLAPKQDNTTPRPKRQAQSSALTPTHWPTAYIDQQPAATTTTTTTTSRGRTPSLPPAPAPVPEPDPMDMDIDTPPARASVFTPSQRARPPPRRRRRPSDAPTDTTRASDSDSADSDASGPAGPRPRTDMRMAPTRLWLAADRADTGLEDMFAQVLGGDSFAGEAPAARDRGGGAGGAGAWVGSAVAVGAPLAILGGVWAAVKALR